MTLDESRVERSTCGFVDLSTDILIESTSNVVSHSPDTLFELFLLVIFKKVLYHTDMSLLQRKLSKLNALFLDRMSTKSADNVKRKIVVTDQINQIKKLEITNVRTISYLNDTLETIDKMMFTYSDMLIRLREYTLHLNDDSSDVFKLVLRSVQDDSTDWEEHLNEFSEQKTVIQSFKDKMSEANRFKVCGVQLKIFCVVYEIHGRTCFKKIYALFEQLL